MFYRSLTKLNGKGGVTAFYSAPFPSSHSSLRTPSFIETINPESVNSFVGDISSSEYSLVHVGSRVFVEEGEDVAVTGIVVAKKSVTTNGEVHRMLTVRLASNGSDIVTEGRKVWLLPYQLNQHGK